MPHLAKHQLVEIRKLTTGQFRKRFQKSRPPKYGSLNKGFTEQELNQFFRAIDNDKFRLLFSYQSQLGLRIGEAIRLNVQDIKFETRELKVKTEKAGTLDVLLIPMTLFKATIEYIQTNSRSIEQAGGYLFFKEPGKSQNQQPHIDMNYARNVFRHYLTRANLDETYDESTESVPNRATRSLHRLTTHSLRHYAITKFASQSNGNVFLTSKFARHRKPNVTMNYINLNKKDLYENTDGAFSVDQAMRLKSRLSSKK